MMYTGKDATKIWDQLEDAIRVVCLEKESMIKNLMKNYKSKTNFFEMARFDFVVDDDLNVFIMEVNITCLFIIITLRENVSKMFLTFKKFILLVFIQFFRSTCRQIYHQLTILKIVYFTNKFYSTCSVLLA